MLSLTAACALASVAGAPARAAGFGPIRAAFFYPWYAAHWSSCGRPPCTNYSPGLGDYSSTNPAVISEQIRAMRYGHITAGIASWWGQGSPEDRTLPALLAAAHGTPFRWTIYYELENSAEPSVSQIHRDLLYIRRRYSHNPNFLSINGRMVVFVYASYAREGCGVVSKWKRANVGIGAYLSISAVRGWQVCAMQPNSWHYYDALQRDVGTRSTGGNGSTGDSSFTISPGFYPYYDRAPGCLAWDGTYPNLCLPRDPTAWAGDIREMVSSGATWQLITTFNEWNEGTAIEEATGLRGWKSGSGYGTYLDALAAAS